MAGLDPAIQKHSQSLESWMAGSGAGHGEK